MNTATKYITVNEHQAGLLNKHLNLDIDDENVFYDGCELLVEFEYTINDESFDHAFGTEEAYDAEITEIYALIDDKRVNIDDVFDLTSDQVDELKAHAMEEAESQECEPDDDDSEYED